MHHVILLLIANGETGETAALHVEQEHKTELLNNRPVMEAKIVLEKILRNVSFQKIVPLPAIGVIGDPVFLEARHVVLEYRQDMLSKCLMEVYALERI